MELTKAHCKRLGVDTGSRVSIFVTPAEETPRDLEARIAELGLTQRWMALSEAQRRAFAETVFEAKKPDTRRARIEHIVATLQSS